MLWGLAMTLKSLTVSIALFALCAATTLRAVAEPLDPDACQRLRTEREALTVLGIDNYFERGADWVKSNLTAADLNLVKRYVNVFEQLKFRCPPETAAKAGGRAQAVSSGPVPPLPVRAPARPARASTPEKAAQPG